MFVHQDLSTEVVAKGIELGENAKPDYENGIIIFAFSLLLFFGTGLYSSTLSDLILITVVLVAHELGHFLAMNFFRYSNPKIFFLPGLGAVTSAKKSSGNAMHEAIVSMSGPIPGILIGIGLVSIYLRTGNEVYRKASQYFLLLNLFNILPISPLDGGRFLESTILRRSPITESIFRIVTAIGLGYFAYYSSEYVLLIFSIFILISIPSAYRISEGGRQFRKLGEIPGKYELVIKAKGIADSLFNSHKSERIYLARITSIMEAGSNKLMNMRASFAFLLGYLVLTVYAILVGIAVVIPMSKPLFLQHWKAEQDLRRIGPDKADHAYLTKFEKSAHNVHEMLKKIPEVKMDTSLKTVPKNKEGDVRVAIIVVRGRESAINLRNKLLEGASFPELAMDSSIGPNSKIGGDIGFVSPTELNPNLRQAVSALAPNQFSGVIETPDGFFIVKRIE
jgi:Zn-dependent protease